MRLAEQIAEIDAQLAEVEQTSRPELAAFDARRARLLEEEAACRRARVDAVQGLAGGAEIDTTAAAVLNLQAELLRDAAEEVARRIVDQERRTAGRRQELARRRGDLATTLSGLNEVRAQVLAAGFLPEQGRVNEALQKAARASEEDWRDLFAAFVERGHLGLVERWVRTAPGGVPGYAQHAVFAAMQARQAQIDGKAAA